MGNTQFVSTTMDLIDAMATNEEEGNTNTTKHGGDDHGRVSCGSWCALIPNYVAEAYGVDDREQTPRKLVRSPYKPRNVPTPIEIPTPLDMSRQSLGQKQCNSDSSIHEVIATIEPFPISPLSPLPPCADIDRERSLPNHSSYSSVDIEHEEELESEHDHEAHQAQLRRAAVKQDIVKETRTNYVPNFEVLFVLYSIFSFPANLYK